LSQPRRPNRRCGIATARSNVTASARSCDGSAAKRTVRFSGKEAAIRNRTYVLANGYDMHVFDRFYDRVKNDPKWKSYALPCGHDVMLDRPEELAKILLDEVRR